MRSLLGNGDGDWLATLLLATLLGLYLWLLFQLVQQLRDPTRMPAVQAAGKDRFANLLALLVGLICLLPLADHWISGYSGYHSIGGLLPYSDAADWLHGTLYLASQGELNDWAARRPLNAVFLSGLLYLSDNQIPLLLIFRALLVAAALACWCRELQRQMPRLPALFVSLLTALLAYPYIPTLLSESHGLLFGLLGFTLLLRGVTNQQLTSYAVGTGLLSCALMLRMGGFGVLLALLLWPFVMTRAAGSVRWFVGAVLGIGAGLGLSLLWGALIYAGDNSSGSNFSYTLYGLAQGGAPWQLFFTHYPEAKLLPEPAQASLAYQAAWSQIQSNPLGLVQGWWQFFTNYWRYLFLWVPGGLGKFLLPIFALGLIQLVWCWRSLSNRFLLFCFLGVLLTTPWIYWSANASRAFIATSMLELIFVGRGFQILVLGGQGLWRHATLLRLQTIQSTTQSATQSAYGTWITVVVCIACLSLIPSWASRNPILASNAAQTQDTICTAPAIRLSVASNLAFFIDLQRANESSTSPNPAQPTTWNKNRLDPAQFAANQTHKNPIAQALLSQPNPAAQLWWVFDAASPKHYRYLMLEAPINPTERSPAVLCVTPVKRTKPSPQAPSAQPLLWQAVAS